MGLLIEKWTANGNNFILVDQRSEKKSITSNFVQKICHPQLGIGADGVIELLPSHQYAFKFLIWNSDGAKASMCGNAARICVKKWLENHQAESIHFQSPQSVYSAVIKKDQVFIHMVEKSIKPNLALSEEHFIVDTGVPHFVLFKKNIDELDLVEIAKPYRHHPSSPEGYNVDLLEVIDAKKHRAKLRVFERGIEGETFSCGTGVAASGWALLTKYHWTDSMVIETKGGEHQVYFENNQLYFGGNIEKLFEGHWFGEV